MSQKRRRITAKMKQEIVLRMLRGEALDILSRELDIPAEKLTRWRETFIQSGIEGLKTKPNSPEAAENRMLKQIIGEKSVEIELLYQKVHKLEAGLYPVGTSVGRSQSRNGRRSSQYDFDLNWKKYGVQKVCQVWEFSRSTFYAQKHRVKPMHRRG